MRNIKIKDRIVGENSKPLVIAELSANHNGSLENALKLVDSAAEAGVEAIKIQTFSPDGITMNVNRDGFVINDPSSLWNGRSLYDLYLEAQTPWEWHKPIFERCAELGVIGFSSPFEHKAVDFLEDLNVPCYKIASFELVDIPLLKKVAQTQKPVILSTGMATVSEIGDAIATLKGGGCNDIILLKCTSTYPASPENTNLLTIPHLKQMSDCQVGISDHTMGIGVSIAAVSLGATVIEKHFTLCRADGGVDSAFSMEPEEMKDLVVESERAWQARGTICYGGTDVEQKSKVFRRSLYIARDLKSGMTLSEKDIRVIRPGYGLEPKYFDVFMGKKVNKDLTKGTPVTWDIIG